MDTASYADYLDVKERVKYYLVQASEHHGGSFASTSAPLPVQVSAGSDAS